MNDMKIKELNQKEAKKEIAKILDGLLKDYNQVVSEEEADNMVERLYFHLNRLRYGITVEQLKEVSHSIVMSHEPYKKVSVALIMSAINRDILSNVYTR